MKRLMLLVAGLVMAMAPGRADAFCGFYVGGAGAEMFNNATQVVLMRAGNRTVLSMQNNYQGPPSGFAMVVPVPVVLQKENVKILAKEVFARVDKLGAPRLVEYWERDPCEQDYPMRKGAMAMPSAAPGGKLEESDKKLGVKIEAQFEVGEYDVVILSATESTGLETWLKREKYEIPAGAEPLLRPYVESGMKFFVAKVIPEKVTFKDGMATLSPLRFHYDSPEFALPIRLGLANAKDKQDLIVNILAPGQRYEMANYKNVTIPTNIDLKKPTKDKFAEFYVALFDSTLERNPGAIVTEYSWDASSCDPCPEPALDESELMTLGGDVLGAAYDPWGMVLTRLHARYGANDAKDDLVFKAAPPIAGGREHLTSEGKLEEGAVPYSMNNFQGRYAIRHAWEGPIACSNPIRGRWGGPPNGNGGGVMPATELAFAPRGALQLVQAIAQDVPELGLKASAASTKGDAADLPPPIGRGPKKTGCGACDLGGRGDDSALGGGLIVLAIGGLVLGRRRRRL